MAAIRIEPDRRDNTRIKPGDRRDHWQPFRTGQRPAIRQIDPADQDYRRDPATIRQSWKADRRDSTDQQPDHRRDKRPDGQRPDCRIRERTTPGIVATNQTGTGFFIREFSVFYPGIQIFLSGNPGFLHGVIF